MRGQTVAVAVIAVAGLAACSILPLPGEGPAPSSPAFAASQSPQAQPDDAVYPTWQGVDGTSFTMEPASDWVDATESYATTQQISHAAAAFTFGEDAEGDAGAGFAEQGGTFAVLSTSSVGLDLTVRDAVLAELDAIAYQVAEPDYGTTGGIETLVGGAGWWGSVSGLVNGVERTYYIAKVFHGEYQLQVRIEGPTDQVVAMDAFLRSLQTVVFVGPEPIKGRHGIPVTDDGRWLSYCRTTAVDVRPWSYEYIFEFDAQEWDCPVDSDYLGTWTFVEDGLGASVSVWIHLGIDVNYEPAHLGIPSEVGTSQVAEDGTIVQLTRRSALVADDGRTVVKLELNLTTPDGFTYPQVTYLVPVSGVGAAVAQVIETYGGPDIPLGTVEEWVMTIDSERV